MSPNRPRLTVESDESAINQVLQAEQLARDGIARARQEAEALIASVHEKARRIDERTDARITRLRTACRRTAAERVLTLQRSAEEIRVISGRQDPRYRRLAQAAARLAAALTGETP